MIKFESTIERVLQERFEKEFDLLKACSGDEYYYQFAKIRCIEDIAADLLVNVNTSEFWLFHQAKKKHGVEV